MTAYDDWVYRIPPKVTKAFERCKTDKFLRGAAGILTHVRALMAAAGAASSRELFRGAYALAVRSLSPRLLTPWGVMDQSDPQFADFYTFFRDHLTCLRARGMSEETIVGATMAYACIALRDQGAKL